MITFHVVRQISSKLVMEYGMTGNDLSQEIIYIAYRVDVYKAGDKTVRSRHIDIEYMFGKCYEINENTSLFQFIAALCKLPFPEEEQEIVIYEKQM